MKHDDNYIGLWNQSEDSYNIVTANVYLIRD